ncbi:MAG: hypothetical protein CVV03_09830 [Firmicutes bacterium HGW-Firmicutes-8]|nr:MAG: hypothetical protein CVV03_09830 [Firmicutes bacterium HGW-Firmicutes-8]
MYGNLKHLRVAKYRIDIKAGERGLRLPPYKGSTFRGGFGSTFRRVVCSVKTGECKGCLLEVNCPYAYIFETSPPPGSEALRNYENIPRPFVIEPPADTRTGYPPGETLSFGLVLFGKAIAYLPYFIVVFRELGSAGIGKGRNPYELVKITACNGLTGAEQVIYRSEEQTVISANMAVTGEDIMAACCAIPPGPVTVDYLTMTRLKYNKSFVSRPDFHILIRNLLRRLSSLMYFHHDLELDIDYKGIIEKASQVKIISDRTRWVDWERYSNRQDTRMNLGGVMGPVTYNDVNADFLLLLKLGELIHVGKAATFGMGKYRIGG